MKVIEVRVAPSPPPLPVKMLTGQRPPPVTGQTCPGCGGGGWKPRTVKRCKQCKGSGRL